MVKLSLHIALDPDELRRNFIGQARSVNISGCGTADQGLIYIFCGLKKLDN